MLILTWMNTGWAHFITSLFTFFSSRLEENIIWDLGEEVECYELQAIDHDGNIISDSELKFLSCSYHQSKKGMRHNLSVKEEQVKQKECTCKSFLPPCYVCGRFGIVDLLWPSGGRISISSCDKMKCTQEITNAWDELKRNAAIKRVNTIEKKRVAKKNKLRGLEVYRDKMMFNRELRRKDYFSPIFDPFYHYSVE